MAAASPPPSPPAPKRPKMSTSSDPEHCSPAGAEPELPRRRYKRRKVAILLGYCGAGYQGMQKNPGARTIEGDLEEALFLAGAVPEADRAAPRRYDWARAARTDKGVSGAAQVVSGRFYVDPPGFAARLNAHLSPQIRAFGYVRVTNSFNAKKFCDRRRYVYLLPVFALDPSAHPDREAVFASVGSGNELVRCVECSERGRKVPGVMGREGKVPNAEKIIGASGEENVACRSGFGSNQGGKCGVASSTDGGETRGVQFGMNRDEKFDLLSSDVAIEACNAVGLNGEEKLDSMSSAPETKHCGDEFGSNVAETSDNGLSVGGKEACNSEAGSNNANEASCSNLNANFAAIAASIVSEGEPVVEVPAIEENKVQAMDIEKSDGEEMLLRKNTFSYSDEVKARFNRILKYYVGTHNFHNFTTRTKAEDPAAKRFIISFNADRTVSLDGIDFVRCEVVGQSFMLHQIRKMIGLAVAVMRNCVPESIFDVAFRKDVNLNVPTAPEVGLYLDECMFTSYNQKWKDSHEAVSMEPYSEEVEEFKINYIFSHIAAMEHKEGALALWLHSLNHRNYPDLRYTETGGIGAEVGAVVEENTEAAKVPTDNISE